MKQRRFLHRPVTAMLAMSILIATASAQHYDIYVRDLKKGSQQKLTTGLNADLYNATWSNNGKKLAFDAVGPTAFPFGQSIYISEINSGLTIPLAGAEGGNDAAWSPGGQTIAFDAWEDYYNIGWWTQNIYTVRASGGTRSLLRLNAHHASWNAAGNKVAFDDGYIGTKDIYTGAETFVTYLGDRPSWSPNGQYIAFDGFSWVGGGIWIIKVDTSGNPTGIPVQITTSGYGPTWKNNSKEIVFIDWPNGDPDVYSISATGGTATRVCGRVGGFDHGDYDPAYSNNGQFIAWSSYTDALLTSTNRMKPEATREPVSNKVILQQNYPNPFSGETKISFRVPKTTHITLTVFNVSGQKIKTLIDAEYEPGNYSISWNGQDAKNTAVAGGLYLYQLRSGNDVQMRKMDLTR